MQISQFLKAEHQRVTAREALPLSLNSLAGVTMPAAQALAATHIKTVFDLATSMMFKTAAETLRTADNGAHFLPALVSTDLIDANGKPATAGEFLDQRISIFRGVGSATANKFETDAGLRLVRDLASWPPYLAAKAILNEAYGLLPEDVLDDEYPEDLVPNTGRYPTERVQYEVLVFDSILGYRRNEDGSLPQAMHHLSSRIGTHLPVRELVEDARSGNGGFIRLESAGPVDVSAAASPAYGFQQPAIGAILTYNQSWYTEGLALGQLLHTLALAPGESTRLAMVDWSRRSRGTTGEEISQTEALSSELERGRSISEVTNAVATEAQNGFSGSRTGASSEQFGAAGGIAAGAPPVFGAAGVAYGTASSTATTNSWASSSGERALNAEMSQNVVDRTHQAATSARNRRATIVREVSQEESEQISTRTVANYNHMHALSIEYFEVVQLYRVAVELARVTRCLFIPMKLINFNDTAVINRFRAAIAAAGLNNQVRALIRAEPNKLAIRAPHQQGPWEPNMLIQAEKLLGEPVGDAASPEIVLPLRFRVGGVYFNEEAPIESITFEFRSGETLVRDIETRQPDDVDPLGKYRVFTPEFAEQADGTSRCWDVTAIRLNKRAGEEDYAGTLRLGMQVWGASRPDAPSLDENFMFMSAEVDVPPNESEVTALQLTRTLSDHELQSHLNDNALYYSQAVWRSLDSPTIALLLSPYTVGDRPVIEVTDPLPVTTAGNYLVFRMYAEAGDAEWREFKNKHELTPGVVREDIVPLPSGGVFAEAVLGRANSAEKIDLTRFWNWQDSPIPLSAPEIAAIQSGSRAQSEDLEPGQLDAPVVNIVNPPSLPDPQGMGAVLAAIQNGNMFRDMSGLAATIGLTQAALEAASEGASHAAGQAGQNMAAAADLLRAALNMQTSSGGGASGGGAQSGGGGAPPAAPNTVTNQGGTLAQARNLDDQETRSITQQTGEPTPPIQRRQEEVLRLGNTANDSWTGGGPFIELAKGGGGLAGAGAALGEAALDVFNGQAAKLFEVGGLTLSGPVNAAVLMDKYPNPDLYNPPSAHDANVYRILLTLENLADEGPGSGVQVGMVIEWVDNCRLNVGPWSLRKVQFKKAITATAAGTIGVAVEEAKVSVQVIKRGIDQMIAPPRALASALVDVSIRPKTNLGTPVGARFQFPLDPVVEADYQIVNNPGGFPPFLMKKKLKNTNIEM
ncbi:MAG: hypothetical protein M3P51_01830 [Chloroflexota bacterium]|nr:hypothetical protein [Chloroflexota bacterium]